MRKFGPADEVPGFSLEKYAPLETASVADWYVQVTGRRMARWILLDVERHYRRFGRNILRRIIDTAFLTDVRMFDDERPQPLPPLEPIAAVPVDLVSMVGARVRGVLMVTSVALRQPELYVYSSDVANALSAVQGMLAELQAALGKVRLDPDDFEGTICQPGMGPSSQWPGESAA